jgi:hypothetical protein
MDCEHDKLLPMIMLLLMDMLRNLDFRGYMLLISAIILRR